MAEGIWSHFPSVFLGILCWQHLTDAQTKCYDCDHVASANDCKNITTCSSTQEYGPIFLVFYWVSSAGNISQQCYTQRFIGAGLNEYYTSGCHEIDVCNQAQFSLFGMIGKRTTPPEFRSRSRRENEPKVTCMQCCTGEYCNKALCGSHDTNMRRCFQCNDVMLPHDCDEIRECTRDEQCFVHTYPHPMHGEYRYRMSCESDRRCTMINRLPDSSFQTGCTRCCQQDYCNYNACDNWTAPAAATTTTILPTAPPPTVTGTPSAHYGRTAYLMCSTMGSVQSIAWYYNKTQPLPPGASEISQGLLKVTNLTEANAGLYTCKVTTHSGLTSQTDATVSISNVAAEVVLVEKVPSHVTVGGMFVIKCTVLGWPTPSVTWQYISASAGGNTVPIGVLYSADHKTLVINTYNSAFHDGTWKCIATNTIATSVNAVTIP